MHNMELHLLYSYEGYVMHNKGTPYSAQHEAAYGQWLFCVVIENMNIVKIACIHFEVLQFLSLNHN